MNELVRFSGNGFLQSRNQRQVSQALERVHGQQVVAAAQEVAAIAVIKEASQAALLAASHISLLEEALASRSPRSEERLRHIADAGALGLTDVVLNAGRRYR